MIILYYIIIGGDIMAFVNVNFRMDEDLKKQMEITCKELGLNMSTAFNIFAKKMTRESRIPFEVSYDPFSEADRAAPQHLNRQQNKKEGAEIG